jgi:hypothetical protein
VTPGEPVHLGVHSTGITQHLPGDRVVRAAQRFEADLDYARKAQAHVWTVIVCHRISDDLAARLAHQPDTEPALDAESVVSVSVGCFRCEEELDARIVHRRCPGDAEDSR